MLQQLADRAFPIRRDARGDGEAFFGIMDRRLQNAVKAELAMAAIEQFPSRNRARHRHRMGRGIFHLGRPSGAQRLGRCSRRRAARAIQRNHRAAAGGDVKAEAIAANAGRFRFDHTLHGASRNGGIHGVPTGAQDFKCGESGLRHGGCGHAMGAIGGAAASKVKITHRVRLPSGAVTAPLMPPLARRGKP